MRYDIQLTVIIFNKKSYISHLAAIAINANLEETSVLHFANRTLIEIKQKEKEKIKDFPVYNLDTMLESFVKADKNAEVISVPKKDCFNFNGQAFIPLSKLKVKNKYHLRFSLPTVRIFGTYYIACNKQKDINTKLFIKPE